MLFLGGVFYLFIYLNRIFNWKGSLHAISELVYILLELLLLGLTIYQWLPSAPKGKIITLFYEEDCYFLYKTRENNFIFIIMLS